MFEYVLAFLVSLSLIPGAQAIEQPFQLEMGDVALNTRPAIVRPIVPKKQRTNSLGIETSGPSVFVADVATGEVLFSKQPHDVRPIASITKLMTAMVLLDAGLDMDEYVTLVRYDFKDDLHSVYDVGDMVTRKDLLNSLIVGSVNTAGNALARTSLGNEEFVAAMNKKAQELKLATPVFVDPTGIDSQNRASAADVAAMLSIAMSYPEIRHIAALSSIEVKTQAGEKYLVKSTNLLLDSFINEDPYKIVGAKTGSLPEAGYCMVQMTADDKGHEIVVASLGSSNHFSRFLDIKALTAWTFDTYEWNP
ncbi:MAG: serine hydrolase [Patescibacteria group bacterium]|nr:serine hydrolase [Patescibacteria group bacterium]MBU2508942.1 serine hydrolase [Patescibacteria group bacterium]